MTDSGDRPDHADAVTEADLEARLEQLRAEVVTADDLADHRADLEESMAAVIGEVLPAIVEDVAGRMAADPFSPAAAAGPAVVQTDYSPLVADAFDDVDGD